MSCLLQACHQLLPALACVSRRTLRDCAGWSAGWCSAPRPAPLFRRWAGRRGGGGAPVRASCMIRVPRNAQVMRKADLVRKNMVQSVRNERNIMALANNPFVVPPLAHAHVLRCLVCVPPCAWQHNVYVWASVQHLALSHGLKHACPRGYSGWPDAERSLPDAILARSARVKTARVTLMEAKC